MSRISLVIPGLWGFGHCNGILGSHLGYPQYLFDFGTGNTCMLLNKYIEDVLGIVMANLDMM